MRGASFQCNLRSCPDCSFRIAHESHLPSCKQHIATHSILRLLFFIIMSGNYFRITLMRSAIGLPAKSGKVLHALGLTKRLATVYHPVSPSVAGQIFYVKELVEVQEVDRALSKSEMRELRRPDAGFYVESRIQDALKAKTAES
jgi:ribosomal protein L30